MAESKPVDFTTYKDKEATTLHKEFAAWICEKTGYDPSAAKSKADAFLAAIRLGATLRASHQVSPENQASIARRRAAAEQAAIEKAKNAPEPKPKADKKESLPSDSGQDVPVKTNARRRPAAKAAEAAPEAAPEAPAKAARPAARRRSAASAARADAPF
jgi:hypothetical protein